ncbi:hypothetical protein LTR17_026930 [Elasticomyces elasticus]|nr:hypothetical protein LTR17_026930 [Elasticomyces elasticus]
MESLDGSAYGGEESVPNQASKVSGTRIQYRECSPPELRVFAAQRGVDMDSDEAERRRYINELTYQDDNPTFEPFLRLPPELRDMIYDMVLAPAPGDLGSRENPIPFVETWGAGKRLAIVQTNREMREQGLGRFYAGNFFWIPVDTTALDMPRREAYRKAERSTAQQGFPCPWLEQCIFTIVVESAELRDISDHCPSCEERSTLPGQIGQWCTGMESERGTKMTVGALDTLLAISGPTVPEGEFDRGGMDKGWAPPAFGEDGRYL